MSDNQFDQLLDLFTQLADGVERLEKVFAEPVKSKTTEIKNDDAKLESDISELKQGQTRIEKQMTFTNRSLNILQSDILNIRTRVEILEQEKELLG
ncbi:MAG: hypothetical protein ABI686_00935 [Acidobacteriota bacterium]